MKIDEIKKVLVVGAGTIGHSIAQVFASHGFSVTLCSRRTTSLERAMNQIEANLSTLVKEKRISPSDVTSTMANIEITTDLESAAKSASFVMEAILEQPEAKRELFTQLDEYCSEDTIIASTTSNLNVYELAPIKNPSRLIIHHWFAPPHIIPLVEVVPGPNTAPELIDLSVELLTKLKKRPVVMKEFVPGFIVNRIQLAVIKEVLTMIGNDWASPEDIDLAVKTSLGIRLPIVGVAQTLDFTGIDTMYDIIRSIDESQIPPFIKELKEKGQLGAKSGKGIYDYGELSEAEILEKRDLMYLKMADFLEALNDYQALS